MSLQVRRLLLFLVCGLLFLGSGRGACPPTRVIDPAGIDFVYDPNLVSFKLMCAVKMVIGGSLSLPVTVCDPDGDPLVYGVQAGPLGMYVRAIDPNNVTLEWTANEAGLHYVGLYVHDVPPGGDIGWDYGSVLVMVYPKNSPPVFTGCGNR